MRLIGILRLLTLTVCLIIVSFLLYPVGYYVLQENDDLIFKENNLEAYSGLVSYVINLDRSKERYDYVLPNIVSLGYPYERISAVEGKALAIDEIDKKVDFVAYQKFLNNQPKLGTIGCYLSHVKAWEQFLNSGFAYAVIFEDDVNFDPVKLKSTIDKLVVINPTLDVVALELAHNGDPLVVKEFDDNNLVIYLTEVSHTGAYVISRHAAKELLRKALPIKMPIDHYFTRAWELDIAFMGIEPRLVHQQYGDSEIVKTAKLVDSHEILWLDRVCKVAYKLQSYVIRLWYNLKIYFSLQTSN